MQGLKEMIYIVLDGFSDSRVYWMNFLNVMWGGFKVIEDVFFGLCVVGFFLVFNVSYFSKEVVYWDLVKMKVMKQERSQRQIFEV